MSVTLEPVVFIVRSGPEHEKHGDPFTASATLLVTGDRAFVAGGSTAGSVENFLPYRAKLFSALRDLGVRRLCWHRIKHGAVREVEIAVG